MERLQQGSAPKFIRNAWYVAMWAKDLPPEGVQSRRILDVQVVLFRQANNTVSAMVDRCAHKFAPLSMGRLVEGKFLQCPYHGLQFDGAGTCVRNPHGGGTIPANLKVPAFVAHEKHTLIWVWLGDPSLANIDKIPDYSCLDGADPVAVTKRDYLKLNASYQLIVDNLLDLSHTSYVHEGILGTSDTVQAEVTVQEAGSSIVLKRFSPDTPVPKMFRSLAPTEMDRGSKWNVITWMPPCYIIIQAGVGGPGDDTSKGYGYYGLHILTPETARTTHYHFAAVRWNLVSDDHAENERIREEISRLRSFAFEAQDAPIIEAQQDRFDESGEARPVLLSIDSGPVRCRRILERMLAAEA